MGGHVRASPNRRSSTHSSPLQAWLDKDSRTLRPLPLLLQLLSTHHILLASLSSLSSHGLKSLPRDPPTATVGDRDIPGRRVNKNQSQGLRQVANQNAQPSEKRGESGSHDTMTETRATRVHLTPSLLEEHTTVSSSRVQTGPSAAFPASTPSHPFASELQRCDLRSQLGMRVWGGFGKGKGTVVQRRCCCG